MNYNSDIADLAEKVLEKQRYLHPMLFDMNGEMYEDIRQKLLKQADFFIQKSIGDISELEVSDIILCGSAARYFYNAASDIDVKVLVKNPNPKILQDTEKSVNELLSLIATTYRGQKIQLYLNNIPIDIKFAYSFEDFLGYYSILKNQWIIKPDPKLNIDVNSDDLIKEYYKKMAVINAFMAELPLEDGTYSVKSLEKIAEFYSKINHTEPNLKDYLAHKMLCKSGQMPKLGEEIVYHYIDSLSAD